MKRALKSQEESSYAKKPRSKSTVVETVHDVDSEENIVRALLMQHNIKKCCVNLVHLSAQGKVVLKKKPLQLYGLPFAVIY